MSNRLVRVCASRESTMATKGQVKKAKGVAAKLAKKHVLSEDATAKLNNIDALLKVCTHLLHTPHTRSLRPVSVARVVSVFAEMKTCSCSHSLRRTQHHVFRLVRPGISTLLLRL